MISRRKLAMSMALAPLSRTALAQSWPSKPVKIIVAYPPGNTMDFLARLLATELQADLGGTYIVENKPGAAGRIAAEFVAKAPADGYTFFVSGNSTHSVNPSLYPQLSYEPLKDFTHVTHLATLPYAVTVSGKAGMNSVRDLTALARAKRGGINYGYGSTASQVAAVAFASLERIDAVGIAYKGQAPAITDLIGGQIDFLMSDVSVIVPHVRSGTLKALAISSERRSPLLPEVPTMSEAGVNGFGLAAWIGLSGPAGLPLDVVNRLSASIRKILDQPKLASQLTQMGIDYAPNTPSQFTSFVSDQLALWGKRVRDAQIKPE